MADEWDSSPVWAEARERMRAEVQAAFAPKPRICSSCGREEATASRHCPHCGASYVVVQAKLSKRAKLTIAGIAAGILAAAAVAWILASPSINRTKHHNTARDQARLATFISSETKRLKLDQRLHRGTAAAPHESRPELVTDLQNAINADALARVKAGTIKGPIHSTRCVPVKLGPLQPNAVRGGYECIAVNVDIPKSKEPAGVIGYPFWAVMNYRRGTFAWCKVNPKPGEMATQTHEPVVDPPAGCNLHI